MNICVSSVVPTPSKISLPVTSSHLRYKAGGSNSPPLMQTRKRLQACAICARSMVRINSKIPANKVGTAIMAVGRWASIWSSTALGLMGSASTTMLAPARRGKYTWLPRP